MITRGQIKKTPFSRKDLSGSNLNVLMRGRWGNADIYKYRHSGTTWVVKDFKPCPPLIRETWGRFMAKREFQALLRLSGLPGIPNEPFLLDDYAVCYHYIPGTTLRHTPSKKLSDDFFHHLEQIVKTMHDRNMVHLDIRNHRNILVDEEGRPALIDFQSSIHLKRVPKALHNFFKGIDMSGVYKHWEKKKPETIDSARKAHLDALNRKRFLWFLKGYPFGLKKYRRK